MVSWFSFLSWCNSWCFGFPFCLGVICGALVFVLSWCNLWCLSFPFCLGVICGVLVFVLSCVPGVLVLVLVLVFTVSWFCDSNFCKICDSGIHNTSVPCYSSTIGCDSNAPVSLQRLSAVLGYVSSQHGLIGLTQFWVHFWVRRKTIVVARRERSLFILTHCYR